MNPSNIDDHQEAQSNINNEPKLKRKKLLKKAPNAPKRFKSAYIYFVSDNMENVKNKLGEDQKITEIMKVLAQMWKDLSQENKLKYITIAEADKLRYITELKNYNGPLQVPNKRRKKPAVINFIIFHLFSKQLITIILFIGCS